VNVLQSATPCSPAYVLIYFSGTDLECQYRLMTFGIPHKAMPVAITEELDKSSHSLWYERRRGDESHQQQGMNIDVNHTVLVVLGPCDVLLGRGKIIQNHEGNLRFRRLIQSQMTRYQHSPKCDKTEIAKQVVLAINNTGGRFLKQTDEGWTEVAMEIAREKKLAIRSVIAGVPESTRLG
jgi:hypothetical protein